MDLGLEGDFQCLRRSVRPEWIAEDDGGDFVRVQRTEFETVFADDIRPDARAAWVGYFSSRRDDAEEVYSLASVVDLVKAAREGSFSFPSDVDVVTGGFPCQDFSVAGKRRGFESTKSHSGGVLEPGEPTEESRGRLYMWMRDVVTLTRPNLFIAENVKGLTNLGDAKAVIEHDFAEAGGGGYVVVPARVLYAPDYGVPQGRERVLFFGFRRDALRPEAIEALTSEIVPPEFDPYPAPTHGEGLEPYVTTREALAGLVEPWESTDESQRKFSRAKFMGRHCQGQTEIKLDAVGPTIRSEHHGNIEYRRLSLEHGGRHLEELAAGLPERRLTVRECARIQTFPDDYQFVRPGVSASDAYKIIGNAVPPVLAYAVARNLQNKWSRWFLD